MGSELPPKGSDTRREPGFDDDEIPTDIIRRDPSLTAKIAKLRLGLPRDPDEPIGEPTVMIRRTQPLASAALPRGLRVWLDVTSGPSRQLSRIEISTVRCVIGRGHQADARVEDPTASRQHAVIFFTGEEFRIRDESSGNGTLLNGSKVVEYCVRDNDELGIGNTTLIFHAKPV